MNMSSFLTWGEKCGVAIVAIVSGNADMLAFNMVNHRIFPSQGNVANPTKPLVSLRVERNHFFKLFFSLARIQFGEDFLNICNGMANSSSFCGNFNHSTLNWIPMNLFKNLQFSTFSWANQKESGIYAVMWLLVLNLINRAKSILGHLVLFAMIHMNVMSFFARRDKSCIAVIAMVRR